MLPGIKRIAALLNMGNPLFPPQWKEIETAARSLGIEPQLLDVRKSEDIGRLFDAAIISRAGALVVGADGVTQASLQSITELATKHRLPTMDHSPNSLAYLGFVVNDSSERTHGGTARLIQTVFCVGDW
jgi:ABC-type uncharacterized transport system substrate-binding protein